MLEKFIRHCLAKGDVRFEAIGDVATRFGI
jgi:hypothetical protein